MQGVRTAAILGLAGAALACTSEPAAPAAAKRRSRLAMIRDVAAAQGVHNGALIGGIAESETHLAHCWSEATYACMGPASPSCDGGPIIAGAADGPCSAMQGGLGMFQFDAGTWDDTLATYGATILTIEGNTAQAVSFVIDKVMLDVPEATTRSAAIAWINAVPVVAGDPTLAQWAQLLACRYNGCCAATALCGERANGYRDHALALVAEQGAAFWAGP